MDSLAVQVDGPMDRESRADGCFRRKALLTAVGTGEKPLVQIR